MTSNIQINILDNTLWAKCIALVSFLLLCNFASANDEPYPQNYQAAQASSIT
ncbi:hypothetical protein [Pseudoalteromonas sp. B62]|uniref:hypothetical protein n=1 Tax=Pseudoalteromonas sp. B62 TaxID=630483 RepID=UPI00301DD98D